MAGGKSSRMNNVNKAFVLIDNHAVISTIIKKISNNNLPIAINANEHLDKFSKFGLEIIKDKFVGHLGPLSGIYSALNWANRLKYKWVFTFPCDVPFFPNDIFLKADNLLNAGPLASWGFNLPESPMLLNLLPAGAEPAPLPPDPPAFTERS